MQNTPYNNQYPNNQYPNQQTPYSTPYNTGYTAPTTPLYQNGPDMPMTFNTVYSIYLLISGALSALSAFGMLFSSDGVGSGIFSLLLSAYPILTGIFLMQRKKAGNIMRLINNIYGFFCAGVLVIVGVLFMAGGGLLTSMIGSVEGAEMLTALGVGVGIGLIIGAIIGIVLNILIMKYYSKRKHTFT